jgi:hypothetical protein
VSKGNCTYAYDYVPKTTTSFDQFLAEHVERIIYDRYRVGHRLRFDENANRQNRKNQNAQIAFLSS